MAKDRIVYLDRDGTINIDYGYISSPEEVVLIAGAGEAIAQLNNHGYKVIVITNQSGVARGIYSEETVNDIHIKLTELLKPYNAKIDGYYFCPHHPSEGADKRYIKICDCRKPAIGLVTRAMSELNLSPIWDYSWMIGDKLSDIALGVRLGCHSIIVRTGLNEVDEKAVMQLAPTALVCDDLRSAVDIIVNSKAF
jgi:D-glycero-D-manno-heptose 1,7-bisphosphate phosphatase